MTSWHPATGRPVGCATIRTALSSVPAGRTGPSDSSHPGEEPEAADPATIPVVLDLGSVDKPETFKVTLEFTADEAAEILGQSRAMWAGQDQIAAAFAARGDAERLSRAVLAWGDECRSAFNELMFDRWDAADLDEWGDPPVPTLAETVAAALDELYGESWRSWPAELAADVVGIVSDEFADEYDFLAREEMSGRAHWGRCPAATRSGRRCRNLAAACSVHRREPSTS